MNPADRPPPADVITLLAGALVVVLYILLPLMITTAHLSGGVLAGLPGTIVAFGSSTWILRTILKATSRRHRPEPPDARHRR